MATDYFLQIAGIPGESQDDKHKDWIDVLSWSWGESHPSAPASGSGAGAGKVNFQDLAFTMRVNKASPVLFLACAGGKHIKDAKLVARKAGKGQQEFLTWTFSDVLVSSYETSGSAGDDIVHDAVTLNFTKAVVSYKAQKADGSLDAPITAGWDAKRNTKI